jgi:hypothetical protein
MNKQEIDILSKVREAAKNIGSLIAENLPEDVHRTLTIRVLEEISKYETIVYDCLQQEVTLGILEAFTDERILENRRCILSQLTRDSSYITPKTDTPRDQAPPAQ